MIKLDTYAFQVFKNSIKIDDSKLDDEALRYVEQYRFDVIVAFIEYLLTSYNATPEKLLKRLVDFKILLEKGKISKEKRDEIYKIYRIK